MKPLLFILLMLTAISCRSQTTAADKANRLLQLKHVKQMHPINKNFDVIKLMFSHGWAPEAPAQHRFSNSFQFQFLKPRPYFRRSPVSLTFGVNFGYKKINFNQSKLVFANNLLTVFDNNNSAVKYAKQRTGYVGFVAMTIIRMNSFTLLTGSALQRNIFSRYKEYPEAKGNPVAYFNKRSINRWSVPLQAQLSWSSDQFLSWGAFYSHDLRPLYKGPAFKNIKQRQFGLSVALII
jgi:hypothetical protein